MKSLERNIVLIGMPGCGKTTIGKMLSEKLNIKFCDIDEYIVQITEKTINELFKNGEEYFRKIESNAVKEVSNTCTQVIATGGGVVKNFKNIEMLKEKGVIFFINRSLDDICKDIDVKTRPLLKDDCEKLHNLYKERYNLYKQYCDYEIINNNLSDCLNNIYKYINK